MDSKACVLIQFNLELVVVFSFWCGTSAFVLIFASLVSIELGI